MSIFGPREPLALGVRTFLPPAPEVEVPPPTASLAKSLYDRLLAAAMDAELAQLSLASAKQRYERGPSEENRRAFLLEAANALDKEIAFDDLWEQASHTWFDGAHA